MGLYKRGQANPSSGENPEDKFWSSKMGVGHRTSNSIPEKNKSRYEISVKYSRLDIWKTN